LIVYAISYSRAWPHSIFEWPKLAEQALDLGLRFRVTNVRTFLDICRDSADWPAAKGLK
jgi:hypothetical protein